MKDGTAIVVITFSNQINAFFFNKKAKKGGFPPWKQKSFLSKNLIQS